MPISHLEIERRVQSYLRAPDAGFWRWSDDGEAAIWQNGATIAFHRELAEIIIPLVDRGGLPPLGAILLVIAATRHSWKDLDTEQTTPILPKEVLANILQLGDKNLVVFDSVISGLNVVHGLDNDVRMSIEAKQTLVDLVFEDCGNLTDAAVAQQVLKRMAGPPEEIWVLPTTTNVDPTMFMNQSSSMSLRMDMQALQYGLTRVSNSVLRTRRETGLNKVVIPTAELIVNEHPSTLVRRLLNHLNEDADLCGVAHAARQLMSIISLPRRIEHPDELPLGGVSDITNRGSLDQLLLSELANDDLTLAVRIAVGQAMYLRREAPPRQTTEQRILVIDSGIRMWGIPRVIATALGLAVVGGTDSRIELSTFSSQHRNLKPIDLTSREGIVKQMKSLQPELHPGLALRQLSEKCDELDPAQSSEGSVDRVLITSSDAINDPEFIQQLDRSNIYPIHIASVDRDGQVVIHEFSVQGRRELRRAKIDVDGLVQRQPLKNQTGSTDLPAIFSAHPFPLRIAKASGLKRAWLINVDDTSDQALAITSDHLLSVWDSFKKGGRMISQTVLPRNIYWSSRDPINGLWCAVVGDGKIDGVQLLKINLETNEVTTVSLAIPQDPAGFTFHVDTLFVIYTDRQHKVTRVSTVDQESGKIGSPVPLHQGGLYWSQDRFFYTEAGENWFALCSSQFLGRLQLIPMPVGLRILAFLECDNIEGPVGITADGRQFRTDENKLVATNQSLSKDFEGLGRMLARRSNGDLVLQNVNQNADGNTPSHWLVSSVNASITPLLKPYDLRQSRLGLRIREKTIRHRFSNISILEEDTETTNDGASSGLIISLQSKGQVQHELYSTPRYGLRLQRGGNLIDSKLLFKIGFSFLEGPPGSGYQLSQAEFPDGSRAVLDSRGFLHLKSSSPDIHELSIVISANTVWRSDGAFWGDEYFYDDDARQLTTAEVYLSLQAFLNHVGSYL